MTTTTTTPGVSPHASVSNTVAYIVFAMAGGLAATVGIFSCLVAVIAGQVGTHLTWWFQGMLSASGYAPAKTAWGYYMATAARMGLWDGLATSAGVAVVGGVATVIALLVWGYRIDQRASQPRHLRGRRGLIGSAAIKDAHGESVRECAISGTGLNIHPAIPISIDRETRHFFFMGSVGGGKTQTMMPLVLQAVARGDKVLVMDTKGDYTSKLPDPFTLIAPGDARSASWQVGKDVRTKQHARDLAARLVTESKDPMWSNAARQLLTGMIVSLQAERGTGWGWRELAELLPADIERLQTLMRTYNPEGLRSIEDANKTTTSILITLASYMSVVFDLAATWPDSANGFSFSEWLSDSPIPAPRRVVVMQFNGAAAELSRGLIGGIIGAIASRVTSPEMPDSTSRRIWLFLDEFPQLGRLQNFAPLLEVGRSRGVRVALGVQDVSQLRRIYSRDEADAWVSMVGTFVIARVAGGDTAEWISHGIVGDREVERAQVSLSSSASGAPGHRTISWVTATERVILPAQLSTELGGTKRGIKALLVGAGWQNAHILQWPYVSVPNRRPPHVPATTPPINPFGGVMSAPPEPAAARREAAVVPVEFGEPTDPTATAEREQPRRRRFRYRRDPEAGTSPDAEM